MTVLPSENTLKYVIYMLKFFLKKNL